MSSVREQLRVRSLHRYPVKSMLGESLGALFVDANGAQGDRRFALIDAASGRVASAKQARLWRKLLLCSATLDTEGVTIEMPNGVTTSADKDDVDELLSGLLGRRVHLTDRRPARAMIERADPEQVLDRGVDVEVDAPLLELAQATPGGSFTDLAPLHAITTATLERIGAEAERYRPNLVIATPPRYRAYDENRWTGRLLTVGGTTLRVLGPTPRCVIPTLEHGGLPRAPHALRSPAADNRVDAFGFGVLPCAGTYLEVIAQGTINTDDAITFR
ncbi:MOSC domain-containing protein [Mycobacterium neglectum]|uniref:MOSC domain-containing protein n=1 Tax=Mycobacterium neglectum TaxID=242737 RepID=UPI000BFEB954|nr:MOSC N-terminal beta barrel domain-containing protein [Mycobacterium neglectum]